MRKPWAVTAEAQKSTACPAKPDMFAKKPSIAYRLARFHAPIRIPIGMRIGSWIWLDCAMPETTVPITLINS